MGIVSLTPAAVAGTVGPCVSVESSSPCTPAIQPLDVTGPHEVFAGANGALDHLRRPDRRYRIVLAGETEGPVRGESGLALHADHSLRGVTGPIDTLLLPGGGAAPVLARQGADLVAWIGAAAARSRRVATVCSGTFLAAAAGLCTGRRVTTHWARAGQLASFCPAATVEPDAIYVQDGTFWSSAGVTAGIDLALALVEEDVGAEVAQLVARHLVVYLRRPGGQTQFAAPVWSEPVERGAIQQARDLIHADPGADHGVAALAARVGLSERHFTRLFRDQVGESPARYVERVRVDAARQLLGSERTGLDEIARRCGFGTSETLRRAFHRRLGLAPDTYRRQFGPRRVATP